MNSFCAPEHGGTHLDAPSHFAGAGRTADQIPLSNVANVPGLENIANLEEVPETGAWIVALPMKTAGGSGGPLRIIALVP
jgi:kynurenine formamidase